MRVVIIGAGNVAFVFGRLIAAANHKIIQVISRTLSSAQSLATELGCPYSDNFGQMDQTADIYILAIADHSLHKIRDSLSLGNQLIVHTAGSVSKEVLHNISTQYGVLYPLQSLRKQKTGLTHPIPLLIDANQPAAVLAIEKFAYTLSSMVAKAGDQQRLSLHLAAVMVNNFTNHLYTLTAEFCKNEGVDFKMLQPLIEETAFRLNAYHPGDMQTGPASRDDRSTLERHIMLLSNYPELKIIYQTFTDSLLDRKLS